MTNLNIIGQIINALVCAVCGHHKENPLLKNFCPSCGNIPLPDESRDPNDPAVKAKRAAWISLGMPWNHNQSPRPTAFDPIKSMLSIGIDAAAGTIKETAARTLEEKAVSAVDRALTPPHRKSAEEKIAERIHNEEEKLALAREKVIEAQIEEQTKAEEDHLADIKKNQKIQKELSDRKPPIP